MPQSPNVLLASLPEPVFARLAPHLLNATMTQGDVVAETDSVARRAHFPHSGVISLVVELAEGEMIETAMVGCDGALNALSALDGKRSFNKAIVQMSGVASTIDIDRLKPLALEFSELRSAIIRHEQVLFAQAQQSAACNATHMVENRMCRWLLRMRDLAGEDDLTVTQEFLAQMLGVRRPTVSLVAHTLQRAGLISYRRGSIRLIDVNGVREGACECYGAVRRHYEQMLAS